VGCAPLGLIPHQAQEACVASQNARRLARLCLAYSNRYMRYFENTHSVALEVLNSTKEVRDTFTTKHDRRVFKNLSGEWVLGVVVAVPCGPPWGCRLPELCLLWRALCAHFPPLQLTTSRERGKMDIIITVGQVMPLWGGGGGKPGWKIEGCT
jgi:hypothetical protein